MALHVIKLHTEYSYFNTVSFIFKLLQTQNLYLHEFEEVVMSILK